MGNPSDPGDGGSRPGTLDDGFNVIAKDLDRAFCLGLSANQAVIMNSVREQSWTAALVARRKGEPRPDPRPARVNLTHLADGSGLNRSRLSTALKGLVAGDILARSDDGYLIKKDYSKWLDDDGKARRFTPTQLAYIRAAKARAKPHQITENSTPLPLQNATPEAGLIDEISNGLLLQNATVDPESAVAKRNSEGSSLLQNATATVAKRNSYCCKTQQRPIEERTAEDFLDSEIPIPPQPPEGGAGVIDPGDGGSDHVPGPSPDPDNEPFTATGTEMPALPVAVENDPEEVARVSAMAERFFPLLDFGQKVRQLAGDVPMWIVEAALWEFKDSGKTRWRYFNGILNRMLAEPEKVKRRPKPPRQVSPAAVAPKKYATAPADWRPNFHKPTSDPES